MKAKTAVFRMVAVFAIAMLTFAALPAQQASAAPNLTTVPITTSQSWNVPAGVTSVQIEAWGGGGGGGYAHTNNGNGGGGGAGGQYVIGVVDVTPGANVTVTIGGGGAGGNSSTDDGANGGDTSFGSLVVAKGGAGGKDMGGTGGAGNSGEAGAGSTTGATVPAGGTVYQGGNGSSGVANTRGGAGGGGAGSGGAGGNASGTTAGTGTATGGGNGGAGRTTGGVGNSGSTYGGGGGGGYRTANNSQNGGTGAAGRIVITYFTVTFNGNGSTGGSMSTQSGAKSTALTSNAFTRSGYTFDGWATTPGGTVAYTNGASYAFTADITLYAHWTALPSDTPTVSNSGQTYTGSPIAITVTCASGGTATNITPSSATNAGTVAVIASCPGNGSYSATTNAAAGNFTINKATPTASLSVSNSATYDGASHSATVGINSSSVPGSVSNISTGGSASQTNAGTYAVTANFVPTDSTNYNTLTGLSAGNFVIAKANPDCSSIAAYSVTYDGSSHTASGSCKDVSSNPLSGLDLTGTTHTDAGTYNGDAWSFTSSDSNYNNANGTVDDVIAKANPDCSSIAAYSVTYDGSSHTASGSCKDVNSNPLSGLDLTGTTHTDAGTYNGDAWSFTSADSNYNNANGTVDDVIAKANPDCSSIAAYSVTYDGSSHTASGSCKDVSSNPLSGLDLTGTTHTDAGTYNGDAWSFTSSDSNYNNANGTVDDVIAKANQATLSITGPSGITVGAADADITTSGGSGSGALTFDVGASTDCSIVSDKLHAITAGNSCSVTATKAADTNYNQATSTSFPVTVSNKQIPTVSTTSGPFTYDGNSHEAVVNGSVAGTVSDVKYEGSTTSPTNAGTYNVTADFLPSDINTYETLNDAAAGSITINKVTLTVTANNQTILAGSPDPTFTFGYSSFVGSEDHTVIDTEPTCSVAGAHSAPGSYDIVCSGGVDNNYSFSYVKGTLTVNAVNNPPTDISLSNNNIDENLAANTLIGTFSTSDVDAGDSFTYTFCGGTDDSSFSISGNELRSAVSFDFETKSSYSICVRSTDSTVLNTTKVFTININNVLDVATFVDVPTSYWAWHWIESIYAAGITGGCGTSPLTYCPTAPVTRAQMAIFLLRGINGSSYSPPAVGASTGFNDVDTSYWAAAWIKELAVEGITGGCGNGNYCPDNPVTRDQMAVFLLRAKNGSGYVPPAVGASTGFNDVDTGYWAAAWIKQLAGDGITSGCGNGNYCPLDPVTRDQMAVFLQRTFNLSLP